MPWFRVDDAFHSHPKVMVTSPAAIGLWTIAGSWAAANLSDGFVPVYVLQRLVPDWEQLAEELVSQRLWMRAKGGFRFRDWDHYQPSKEEVQKDRESARVRQQKRRKRLRDVQTSEEVSA